MCRYGLLLGLLLLASGRAVGDAKEERQQLQGTWVATAAEQDGDKMGKKEVQALTIEFKGDRFTVTVGDRPLMSGSFTVDPGKDPKAIDMKSKAGRAMGETILAIYDLDNDKLRLCLGDPGKKRPTAFVSTKKNKHFFGTFKRKKS